MSMLITSAYAMRVAAAMMTVAELNRAIRRACSAIEFAGCMEPGGGCRVQTFLESFGPHSWFFIRF